MIDIAWLASLAAGAVCFGAGMLGWMKAPRSVPAAMFLLAMVAVFVAMITGPMFKEIDQSNADTGNTIAKVFAVSSILAVNFLWELTLFFPVERKVSINPPNFLGIVLIFSIAVSVVAGSTVNLTFDSPSGPTLTDKSAALVVVSITSMIVLATGFSIMSWTDTSADAKRASRIFLLGLWIFAASGAHFSFDIATGQDHAAGYDDFSTGSLVTGVTIAGLLFAYATAKGQMTMMAPVTEKLVSGAKAKYKLLLRRVYLVEEAKPEFSMKMFTDITKGRCYDCEDDDSFACESLGCSACSLPCPCRECKKYSTRTQGLVVTRQFPKDVRSRYFLQTTPMLWLSTVPGKDNMDPGKLSLLTDYLVTFMEKSPNGVVLVDGIEYLVTSNDFPRVLKAIDRWTETAMTSNSRLIMSVDIKAFDSREVAVLERNREVVRPDAAETWRVMPEPI